MDILKKYFSALMTRLQEWRMKHYLLVLQAIRRFKALSQYFYGIDILDIPPSTSDQIMVLGYPSTENILERYGYVISYNFEYKVTKWVCECLTCEHVPRKKKKCEKNTDGSGKSLNIALSRKNTKCRFKEDIDIIFDRRARLSDYTAWPKEYQKGHLAAAGNHRYNLEAYESTFFLSNIVPMCPNVNKIIGDIENQARSFAEEHGKVYIITGPVFYRKRKLNFVGNGGKVLIPDAIFKVVVHEVERKPHLYRVRAYLVLNLPKKTYNDIYDARVYLADINKVTGLNILCKVREEDLVDDLRKNKRRPRGHGL